MPAFFRTEPSVSLFLCRGFQNMLPAMLAYIIYGAFTCPIGTISGAVANAPPNGLEESSAIFTVLDRDPLMLRKAFFATELLLHLFRLKLAPASSALSRLEGAHRESQALSRTEFPFQMPRI